MIVVRTASPDETRRVGAEVAALVRPGDVVLLAGDLGSGKTVFTQGFGAALGVADRITSPTFTLVHCYPGRLPVVHADLYRLDDLQEVIDLALPELLDDGAVAIVEWGDTAAQAFTADYLSVRLDFDEENDDARLIRLRPVGPSWMGRAAPLEKAVAHWPADGGRP